ncbi:MerR family DNA-binding transcriptional regulator, partial [Rhodococcus triatomae]
MLSYRCDLDHLAELISQWVAPPAGGREAGVMLGISEFAALTGLSVKALRHYDEKG